MKAKISFTLELFSDCTKEQFEEWLNYEVFKHEHTLSGDNPLVDVEFDFEEAINQSIEDETFEYEVTESEQSDYEMFKTFSKLQPVEAYDSRPYDFCVIYREIEDANATNEEIKLKIDSIR